MTHILLVEDDPGIISNLTEFLQQKGFCILTANGETMAKQLLADTALPIDLALIDVSLADGDGFSLCKSIKSGRNIPFIFLTASGDEASVVKGLELGAEDYIAKPFRPLELVSRIHNVMRRYSQDSGVLTYQDLTLDPARGIVTRQGQEIYLSALEYRLLLLFFQNMGLVLSRTRILEELWDIAGEYVNDNTLTVYIKRLREKIEPDPANPTYIRTLRGLGYKLGE
ncbi:MAG: response regulator transcription factor [Roseburia sp.]